MNMKNANGKGDYAEVEKTLGDKVAEVVVSQVRRIYLEKEIRNSMKNFIYLLDGECYANDRLIDFPDKEALYFLLVKALVTCAQADGSCSYKAITDFWMRSNISAPKDPSRSVHNAILQLYRARKSQKVNFPVYAPDKVKVIRNGKNGLIFHNPLMRA